MISLLVLNLFEMIDINCKSNKWYEIYYCAMIILVEMFGARRTGLLDFMVY